MTPRSLLARLGAQEDINFLLTNRIPRRWLTLFMGWFSRIEHPWVRDASLGIWRTFTDLDLSDAHKTDFRSVHDCFTRSLKDGARPIDADPDAIVSPCDAIVGAHGVVTAGILLQAKGFPYRLTDLLADDELQRYHEGCAFITLRLTSAMYHHFHAPLDCTIEGVTYISGDTWNVNPIALRRIERLFCRNERAVIRCRLDGSRERLTLVPVAAILVASIRLHCLPETLHLRYQGPNKLPCNSRVRRGEELGWFEHGSTIILFAPPGFGFSPSLHEGKTVRVGEAILKRLC